MKKSLLTLIIILFSLPSANAIISTIPGKPGQFQEHPDRYKGRGPVLVPVVLWIARLSAQGIMDHAWSTIGIVK